MQKSDRNFVKNLRLYENSQILLFLHFRLQYCHQIKNHPHCDSDFRKFRIPALPRQFYKYLDSAQQTVEENKGLEISVLRKKVKLPLNW